jgi:iron complex outermembrane recepter protein
MKKLYAFVLAASGCIIAAAQNNAPVAATDTMRIIQLQEVSINSVTKTAQQRLVNFFKSNNAATLEDIMGRLPELSLTRRGAYGMEPAIRYFNGGQINVQLDGMNIHGACTDKMDPATIYIEPINLQHLQVQTANSGFINGSSIGGTINMKMTEPGYLDHNKLTGVISSGYQTAAKSLYQSLKLNYSSGKWAVAASGTYRNNRNYRSGGGAIVPFSQYEKVNYALSVKFKQNQYYYFKADVLADDGWNIGYTALPMDVGYAAARIASFSWHKENPATRLYKWQTKIYANTIRHFMDDSKRPLVPMHMDMPGQSKTMGAYTEGEIRLNKKQKLSFRADGSSAYLKASMTMYQTGQPAMYMLTWPDNRKDQYGISASWIWQPDSLLQLQVSARTDIVSSQLVSAEAKDHVAIFDNTFTGRTDGLKNISAQLTKNLGYKIKLTTAIGYAERLPTASELFGFYLFNASDGYDYIGNPRLKSESSLQADLSLLYNSKKTRVQLNGYYSRVSHFIAGKINSAFSTMTVGANGVKSYNNLSYARVAGAELSGFFKPLNAVDIITTTRYTSAKDNNNQPLPAVAPVKNISSVRYQPKQFSVQVETEMALAQNQVSNQYGEDKTAGYFLLHSRIGYNTTIFKNNIALQAGVENIFDKKYHDHLDWGNIARPGRNIYIQLQFTFNN